MTFKPGVSGNPHGNRHHSRHLLNQEFIQALLLHFRQHGKKAIEKVARNQPAAYLKILALLMPKEMRVEHNSVVKAMSDEAIEEAITVIQQMLAARAEAAKVIEGQAESVALPPPSRKVRRKVRRTPEVEPSEQYAQSAARPPGGPASDIDTALDSSESA